MTARRSAKLPSHGKLVSDLRRRYRKEQLLDSVQMSKLYSFFKERRTADLGYEDFAKGMRTCDITDEEVLRQYYRAFDKNGDGRISFEEMAVGLATLQRGRMGDRLRMAFQAFDLDRNGFIDHDELVRLIQYSTGITQEGAIEIADKALAQFDTDGNRQLDYKEFEAAARQEPVLVKAFWRPQGGLF